MPKRKRNQPECIARSFSPELPPELLNLILEHLIEPGFTRADTLATQTSLHAFARVNKAWYKASVKLSYRTLIITHGSQLRSLLEIFQSNPVLARSVYKLSVWFADAYRDLGRQGSHSWRGSLLASVLQLCINVRDLDVQVMERDKRRVGALVWNDLKDVLVTLSKMQRFTINADVSFASIAKCIANWRHLRHLEVHGCVSGIGSSAAVTSQSSSSARSGVVLPVQSDETHQQQSSLPLPFPTRSVSTSASSYSEPSAFLAQVGADERFRFNPVLDASAPSMESTSSNTSFHTNNSVTVEQPPGLSVTSSSSGSSESSSSSTSSPPPPMITTTTAPINATARNVSSTYLSTPFVAPHNFDRQGQNAHVDEEVAEVAMEDEDDHRHDVQGSTSTEIISPRRTRAGVVLDEQARNTFKADSIPKCAPWSRMSWIAIRRTELNVDQLEWLLSGRTFRELEHLDLGCLPDESVLPREQLARIILPLGHQLKSLRVVESRHFESTNGWMEMILKQCANLESLDVGSVMGISAVMFGTVVANLSNLRRLTVHPGKPHGSTRALCYALALPQATHYPTLKKLTIHGTVGNLHWSDVLEQCCRQRGIELR